MELLKKLTQTSGAPGQEHRIIELVKSELTPLVDEITTDRMGNVVAHKKGNGPKIMLMGHMDQIGFMVSHIDEDGFIRFQPTGGFDPKTLTAQRVMVHGKEDLLGVLGSKPIHVMDDADKKKPPQLKDYFVDLGLPAKKVKKLVKEGDAITWLGEFAEMGDMYLSRAFDDRIGVYLMIEALRKRKKHDADIYAVATVQEEVGVRGAMAAAQEIRPEIGIALDVTIANDVPGAGKHEACTRMGEGIAIKRMDSYSISSRKLTDHLESIATDKKIPFQFEILPRGGTDAGALWHTPGGAYIATLSVPSRYVHSTVELVHKTDVKAGIDLLAAYLEKAGERDYSF